MKLVSLEVKYRIVVRAKNAADAQSWVWANYEEALQGSGDPDDVNVVGVIHTPEDIPDGWDGGVPFGHNPHNNTCNELLSSQSKEDLINKLSTDQMRRILSYVELDDLNALLENTAGFG